MNNIEFQNIKNILDNRNFLKKSKNIYVDRDFEDYAFNFALQWNKFPLTQYDSYTGFPLTKNRLLNSSGWNFNDLNNKLVIELGSGAGRFTEILLSAGCYVVSVEMSDAVYVNSSNNKSDRVIFIKSSLNNLEFLAQLFDFVFCYGVAQHTPNLLQTYKSCYNFGKRGSKISIDHYLKLFHPTTKSFWRPLTKRINPKTLLKIISFYIPLYFPIDTFIKKKIPLILGKFIRCFLPIPCFNYTNIENFPKDNKELVKWAIMDTFDALAAKYDSPLTTIEMEIIAKKIGLTNQEIKRCGSFIVLNGTK